MVEKDISGSGQQSAGHQHTRGSDEACYSDNLISCLPIFWYPDMHIMKQHLYLVLLFTAVVLSCAHHTVFDRIENGDFSMVEKGRYNHPAMFLDEGGAYRDQVLDIRRSIEKHADLMPLIARQYFHVASDPVFTYKYVMLDTLNDCFVLRYFAYVYKDPRLAGYEIFFRYSNQRQDITGIYTNEVPLE